MTSLAPRHTPRRFLSPRSAGLLLAAALIAMAQLPAAAADVAPAVYTSDAGGTSVNPPNYPTVNDVYLTGAPCTPSDAPRLSEGDYYFDVADASTSVSLSSDSLGGRLLHIDAVGRITTPAGTTHALGVDNCPQPDGETIQLQPFGPLPADHTQYSLRLTTAAAASTCVASGQTTGFCDPQNIWQTGFAIAPSVVSPSAGPSDAASASAGASEPAASASASPTGTASPTGSASAESSATPGTSATPTPTPASSPTATVGASAAASPSTGGSPTPDRPTSTPAPTPTSDAAGPPATTRPIFHEPSASVGPARPYATPTPAPTARPVVIPSGFYVCKPNEVVTQAGCMTQGELNKSFAAAYPGGVLPTTGISAPPQAPAQPAQPAQPATGGGGAPASPGISAAQSGAAPSGATASGAAASDAAPTAGGAAPTFATNAPSGAASGGPDAITSFAATNAPGHSAPSAEIAAPAATASSSDPASAQTTAVTNHAERTAILVILGVLIAAALGAGWFVTSRIRRRGLR